MLGIYYTKHRVHIIGISITRRFQKSVDPSVCNANKNAYYIINSRIIICISDEGTWHPLQENEAMFSENKINRFSKIIKGSL